MDRVVDEHEPHRPEPRPRLGKLVPGPEEPRHVIAAEASQMIAPMARTHGLDSNDIMMRPAMMASPPYPTGGPKQPSSSVRCIPAPAARPCRDCSHACALCPRGSGCPHVTLHHSLRLLTLRWGGWTEGAWLDPPAAYSSAVGDVEPTALGSDGLTVLVRETGMFCLNVGDPGWDDAGRLFDGYTGMVRQFPGGEEVPGW